jgi:hypothetical protein
MDESSEWNFSRSLILFIVLTLHVAVVAVLMMAPRAAGPPDPMQTSVELVYLPPVNLPKVRSEAVLPRRLSGEKYIPVAPPTLDASLLSPESSAGSVGSGSGVNWAAEARRALQAYEIRNHRPPHNNSVSGSPAEEHWWPRTRHHAGEQYKTDSGDWIVWISDSCYQIATSGPSTYAPGATQPQTVCVGQSAETR